MNTVAIVGSHPRTRALFDFDRTDCAVWIFNEAFTDPQGWAKRADAVFQMHAPEIWRSPLNRNDPKHYEWLQTQTAVGAVYMQEAYPDVPAVVRYPLEEVRAMLGANFNHDRYFTSSISYAIALAIYREYDRIEIYGVEMETNTEYMYQRDCVAFWTGYAAGRGIEVYTPINMFSPPYLYGYEGGANLGAQFYAARTAALKPEAEKMRQRYAEARLLCDGMIGDWNGTIQDGQKIVTAVIAMSELASNFGNVDGALQEAERYAQKDAAQPIVRQEYEAAAQGFERQSIGANNEAIAAATRMESIMTAAHKAGTPKARQIAMKPFTAAMNEFIKACTVVGVCRGAGAENMRYAAQLDELVRMAGGAKSYEVLTAKE